MGFVGRLLLVFLATPVAAAASAAPKSFEAWTVTCDNTGACVVLGAADSDDLLYLRIARPAGAAATPGVKIVLDAQTALRPGDAAFRMTASTGDDRTRLGPFPAVRAKDDQNMVSVTMADGPASLAFIDLIRDATTLDASVLGAAGTFALKGLSAALRDRDARQGRAGTPTALVAKGMTPIGQVPPAVAPPEIEAATPGSVTAVEKPTLAPSLRAVASAVCDPETVAAHDGLEAWRLGPVTILTAVPCEGGAYNITSALYLTTGDGAPRPVMLPRPPGAAEGDQAPANTVVNESFDPRTMVLTSFAKGRGIGDCGTLTDWLWTGNTFALLDASGVDACPGALPEDWPSLYVAKRR